MGTNYYLHTNVCKHCGKGDDKVHIGKSSGGWCFALHVYPDGCFGLDDIKITNLDDWKVIWATTPNSMIKNEYGDVVSIPDMLDFITDRSWSIKRTNKNINLPSLGVQYRDLEDFYKKNHASPGPNNLLRHDVYPNHCIGHGEGTWDYIIGEFS